MHLIPPRPELFIPLRLLMSGCASVVSGPLPSASYELGTTSFETDGLDSDVIPTSYNVNPARNPEKVDGSAGARMGWVPETKTRTHFPKRYRLSRNQLY